MNKKIFKIILCITLLGSVVVSPFGISASTTNNGINRKVTTYKKAKKMHVKAGSKLKNVYWGYNLGGIDPSALVDLNKKTDLLEQISVINWKVNECVTFKGKKYYGVIYQPEWVFYIPASSMENGWRNAISGVVNESHNFRLKKNAKGYIIKGNKAQEKKLPKAKKLKTNKKLSTTKMRYYSKTKEVPYLGDNYYSYWDSLYKVKIGKIYYWVPQKYLKDVC
ncbi:hypothetical protein EQG49_04140 [Periweissella cryptocerci]|uniref:SH3 domain-containing protein n=1 Tax=Periweissella cryptocerci TaxID=2506420 RepID=A0A4P6YSU4_9LACO|nr:hypothetical protein [Periweissella cryptocerci]QBO35707.1 hypothetical protein EQG49_04140 [Periweissella cryptocerci]